MKKLPVPELPNTGSSFDVVAGVRLVADCERLTVVRAHWRYRGAKHAEREMARVGTAA